MMILDTSKSDIVSVMTKGKNSFGTLHTFSLSWNLRIGISVFPSELAPSSLLTTTSFMILIFIVPLEGFIGWRKSIVDGCDVYTFSFSVFFFFIASVILSLSPVGNLYSFLWGSLFRLGRFFLLVFFLSVLIFLLISILGVLNMSPLFG